MPLNSTRGAGSAKGFGLTAGSNPPVDFDFLIISGGGGGGGGGGGAGGYRTSFPGGTKITIKGGNTDITVGAGAVGSTDTRGESSVIGITAPITSTGGGVGFNKTDNPNTNGGSGGGAGLRAPCFPQQVGGDGNFGGFSPPEGNNGAPGKEVR